MHPSNILPIAMINSTSQLLLQSYSQSHISWTWWCPVLALLSDTLARAHSLTHSHTKYINGFNVFTLPASPPFTLAVFHESFLSLSLFLCPSVNLTHRGRSSPQQQQQQQRLALPPSALDPPKHKACLLSCRTKATHAKPGEWRRAVRASRRHSESALL